MVSDCLLIFVKLNKKNTDRERGGGKRGDNTSIVQIKKKHKNNTSFDNWKTNLATTGNSLSYYLSLFFHWLLISNDKLEEDSKIIFTISKFRGN